MSANSLLDINRNNWGGENSAAPVLPISEAAQKINSARKFAAKLSFKRKNALRLASEITDYFDEQGIALPVNQRIYKDNRAAVYSHDTDLESDLHELANLKYKLESTGTTIYAHFMNVAGAREMVPTATIYSKHRFDEVWLYRKSQLIRSKYAEYFKKHPEYLTDYHPVHLVLTVPHAGGVWKDKRFYAREMMKEFNEMRKSSFWKGSVYAGEYGLEITKSKTGNGLHIHIHALVFQEKHTSVNEMRKMIRNEWRKRVGSSANGSNCIWYETAYTYRRKANGQFETFDRYVMNVTQLAKEGKTWEDGRDENRWEKVSEKIKEYVTPQSTERQFLDAVFETIKYHFKMDSVIMENGSYDVELIKEILNNSRGLRFYSRFGAFYKESELNFNNVSAELPEELELEEPETETENEAETDKMHGDTSKMLKTLYNPFTSEIAAPNEYCFAVGRPEKLKYLAKPTWKYVHKGGKHLEYYPPGTSVKSILLSIMDVPGGKMNLESGYKPQPFNS